MNERIRYGNDYFVEITPAHDSGHAVTLTRYDDGKLLSNHMGTEWWDATGRAALIEALQALEADGDFRALRPKVELTPFTDLPSGTFFKIEGDSKNRIFMKHVTTPFGNECATDEEFKLYLFNDETPCIQEPAQ